MSSEETIFAEALNRPSPADRAAYLARACGDDADLRREVESLLAAHDRAGESGGGGGGGGILDAPPPDLDVTADAAFAPAPAEAVGSAIGPYKLIQPLGEGGMGVVYLAEQTRPVRRTVAVKIIKQGMDTRQVIARFEAERQALAVMDHPNIAKVLDAGTTDAGRPYFVMELVRGIPITDYCDQHQLTTRQRLELFLPVCQAVQHAHQKGIIHRDLKPANVLVTFADGDRPTPKVIDFGVAKAVAGQRLTAMTLVTEFRQLVGTPLYMSPEQAEMSAVMDVDTRSDVYSLGVLLYELLTGTTPFDKQRLAAAAYDEVRRIIREEEPPRPSTRLSTMGDVLTTVSASRATDPKRLSQTVRGELDWIVMKALEKDRARRYETASGLARDVERYLADEPVEASPPGRVYRLRKLARRYRRPLRAAAAFALLLVAATAVSTWEAVRATRAEARAKQERDAAVAARQRADEQAAVAKAVNEFLNENVLGQASVYNQTAKDTAPNPDLKVREALDRADASIGGRFKDQPVVEAAVQHTIGDAYADLNEFAKAEQHLAAALRLRRQMLGEADPDTLETLTALASLYRNHGLKDKAESLLAEGLKTSLAARGERDPATLELLHLEALLRADGHGRADYAAAATLLREVLDGQRVVLGSRNRRTFDTTGDLGSVYCELGHYAEAEPLLKQALAAKTELLGWTHPGTCQSTLELAVLYLRQRRYREAEELLLKALEPTRQLFGPRSTQLALTLTFLAQVYEGDGRLNEAASVQRQVLETWRQANGEDDPETLVAMSNLARTHLRLGQVAEAEALMIPAVRGFRKVLGNRHSSTIRAMNRLGQVRAAQGRYDEAESLYTEALAASREVFGPEDGETAAILENLFLTLDARAQRYRRLGKSKEADADVEKLIRLGDSDTPVAACLRARWYQRSGRFDEALADWSRAVTLDPSDRGSREQAAALHLYLRHEKEYLAARRTLVGYLREQKRTTDHPLKTCLLFPLDADELNVCMAIADRNNVPTYKDIPFYHSDKGLAEYRAGNYEEAVKWLSQGRKELDDLLATHPPDPARDPGNIWDEVRTTNDFVIAMCQFKLGRHDDAREALALALEHLRTSIPSASSGRFKVGLLDWLMVQIIAREAENTILGNDHATTMPATMPSPTQPAPLPAKPPATRAVTRPVAQGRGPVTRPAASTSDPAASAPPR